MSKSDRILNVIQATAYGACCVIVGGAFGIALSLELLFLFTSK